MRKVDVYNNDVKAGELTELIPGGECVFKYDPSYLTSKLPSISVNLPLGKSEFRCAGLFPFFSNMLPEGTNKERMCRTNKIDEEDTFGQLFYLADGDFIGAVNVRNARYV